MLKLVPITRTSASPRSTMNGRRGSRATSNRASPSIIRTVRRSPLRLIASVVAVLSRIDEPSASRVRLCSPREVVRRSSPGTSNRLSPTAPTADAASSPSPPIPTARRLIIGAAGISSPCGGAASATGW